MALRIEGQAHLSTSLSVPNGHVTISKEQAADDHMTTDSPVSMEDHQTIEADLTSASEITSECDLYSLSCSALPDKTSTSESYDHDVPQSISAPQLPQRGKEEEGKGQEDKPGQREEEKPTDLSELDQEFTVEQDQEKEMPNKSELKEDELVQQDQEKTTEPQTEQKVSEESEHGNSEEMLTEQTLVEGEERDSKRGDQISEPTETKAMNEVNEDRNDITTASDDVAMKDETTEASPLEADTSIVEGVQIISNLQTTSEAVESTGDIDEVPTGDDGEGKMQLDGEEEGSSARNEESQLNKTEQCEENSPSSSSLAGERKGEEGVDESTQNNSHKSLETPPTIPESTPPPSEESSLNVEESSTLEENSPTNSSIQSPPQINPTTSVDTEDIQSTVGKSSQPIPALLELETPLSGATHDPMSTHPLDTTPNVEQSSTPGNCIPPETALEWEESFTQSQDPPNIELFSLPEHSEKEEPTSSSPPAVEAPWSPNTASLARDVQDLLLAVQAPLEEEQMVRVPSISRNSRYYRVSVKGSTPKGSRRGLDESSTPKLNRHSQEVSKFLDGSLDFIIR